jgi:hypothetical protein
MGQAEKALEPLALGSGCHRLPPVRSTNHGAERAHTERIRPVAPSATGKRPAKVSSRIRT